MRRNGWRMWMAMLAAGVAMLAGAVAFAATGLPATDSQPSRLPHVITARPAETVAPVAAAEPTRSLAPTIAPAPKPAPQGLSRPKTGSGTKRSATAKRRASRSPSRPAPAPRPAPKPVPAPAPNPEGDSEDREVVQPGIREESRHSGLDSGGTVFSGGGGPLSIMSAGSGASGETQPGHGDGTSDGTGD